MKQPLDGRAGGRCAVVLDEGFLFRTNEGAFVDTKRKLLDECDLWCILSLPGGVFSAAGAGVKTNLLFFTKGRKTERIWYYDLSHIKMGKKSPMTLAHFGWSPKGDVLDDAALPGTLTGAWREQDANQGKPYPTCARLLPSRGTPAADSDRSWTIDFAARRTKARDEIWRPISRKSRNAGPRRWRSRTGSRCRRSCGPRMRPLLRCAGALLWQRRPGAKHKPRRMPSMPPCTTSRR